MSNSVGKLSSHQFTVILIGSMMGYGMLSLPSQLIPLARQDAWISSLLGGIYPLYVVLLANYFHKKHPKLNLFLLSKLYFGKFLGTTLNIIFAVYFISLVTITVSGVSNVLQIYMSYYISNTKILLTIFLVPAFIVSSGIKTLGRLSEVIFYITLPIFIIPLFGLKEGNILNLMPLGGSGLTNIFEAINHSFVSYSGVESIFLLYPLLNDKNKIKTSSYTSTFFTILIYSWITFVTIFYLTIYCAPNFIWSFATVTESISIQSLNSLRFVSIGLWFLLSLKILSVHYFSSAYSLALIIKKVSIQNFVYILYPIFIWFSRYYGPPTSQHYLAVKLLTFYIPFNFIYLTAIAICILIKQGDKYD